MRLGTLFFRRLHKWVGLILGLQFLLWAASGAVMATLDMKSVGGGEEARVARAPVLPDSDAAWPAVQRALAAVPIRSVSLKSLLGHEVLSVETAQASLLFDTATGAPVHVDAVLAGKVALAAHPGRASIKSVAPLENLTLAVRNHALPIWRVDFADEANSSYYVSGITGAVLERRNDSWRVWDFFWMLHTMDYANRASFNHPLIVIVAIGVLWLSLSGIYLIFRTNWRSEMRWLRRRFHLPSGDASGLG